MCVCERESVCVDVGVKSEREGGENPVGVSVWVVEAAACLRERPRCCEGKVRWTEGWRGG